MYTHTFTKKQATELKTGTDALLASGFLDADEMKAGRKLSRQFGGSPNRGETLMDIYTSDEGEKFLQKLMEGMWTGREK